MIEEVVYSEDGPAADRLVHGLRDFRGPIDFPRFELGATVTPDAGEPASARKGVGEAGTLGSTPCVVRRGGRRAQRVRGSSTST